MGVQLIPELDAPSNPGEPLDANLVHEARTVHHLDLLDVKYHVGHEATLLGAAAFTSGKDIYVAPGNEHLVAHEALHSVQQTQGVTVPTLAENLVEVSSSSEGSQ